WQMHQVNMDVLEAVITEDEEQLNEVGEQFRKATEIASYLMDVIADEIGELDDYDAGRVAGRITGEVVVQVGTALVTAGVGNVLKNSELMASLIAKLGAVSDTVLAAAAKGKLLAGLEPGGKVVQIATTKMCF